MGESVSNRRHAGQQIFPAFCAGASPLVAAATGAPPVETAAWKAAFPVRLALTGNAAILAAVGHAPRTRHKVGRAVPGEPPRPA